MTAIIANQGLGLFDATRNSISNSPFENANVGQSGVGINFNVATGNIVVWDHDYTRVGQGTDARFSRSYNSLGHVSDTDGWRFSFERELLIGTSITRVTGDEHRSVFNESSAGSNLYISHEGAGAHDTIEFNGTDTYTYIEGTTGQQETYKQQADGRWLLESSLDANGDGIMLEYDTNYRVSRVVQANGGDSVNSEYTQINYHPAGQVASLQSYAWDDDIEDYSSANTSVHYLYDTQGRLERVRTDLTPSDNDITDDEYYELIYSYQNETSLLLASISQSDGSQTSFTYDSMGRISTYALGSGLDGAQQSFTFDYSQVDNSLSNQVSVTNNLNQTWTYEYDAGRLTRVISPSSNGMRTTAEYEYDPETGDLIRSIDGEGRIIAYRYDNGNLIRQIDSEGNRVDRSYSNTNKLLSETLFLDTFDINDIDILSSAELNIDSTNTQQLTTLYIYDENDLLRFIVSADKRVTEYQYYNANASRSISDEIQYDALYDGVAAASLGNLNTWVAGITDKSSVSLISHGYDFRGQLNQTRAFGTVNSSGIGVEDEKSSLTRYVYDASGNLVSEVRLKGVNRDLEYSSNYVFDGMNRLTSTSDHLQQQTRIAYQNDNLVTTADNGLTTTQVFNSHGLLVSSTTSPSDETQPSRDVQYYYDDQGRLAATRDAAGGISYRLYNEQGQLQFLIDSTGSVAENFYDNSERLISVRQYSNRIDTTSWSAELNGMNRLTNPISMGNLLSTDDDNDRLSQTILDDAGRIEYTVDGEGNYSYFFYDGASRIVRTESRQGNDDSLIRVSHNFYNEDGLLIGSLDPEGYVTSIQYNGRGLVTESVVYATESVEALRESASLDELIIVDPEKDARSFVRYDSFNRQVMSINAEGFVIETRYLESGNQVQTIEYAKAFTGDASSATIAEIIIAIDDTEKRVSSQHFDSLGRMSRSVNFEGAETLYRYNNVNQLIQVTVANGINDADGNSLTRSQRSQYNLFGDLIGEVQDDNHIVLSDSQMTSLVATKGVTHQYDAFGRRSETVDAEGNRIFYFYDEAGRLSHTVNGDGEVVKTDYNAFGEVEQSTYYADKIDTTELSGATNSELSTRISSVASAVKDVFSQHQYDRVGNLHVTTHGTQQNEFGYNAWRELVSQTSTALDGSATTRVTGYQYDNRGNITHLTNAAGEITESTYDAFGRLNSVTNAAGRVTSYQYDKLGRQVLLTDPLGGQIHTSYDAFNRVLTTTDKQGFTTEYVYDDSTRSTTIIFADNSTNISLRNAHGEAVETTDGLGGKTQFTFNYKGELTHITDALGQVSESQFDEAGRLVVSIDNNQVSTSYHYDQAGRVLTQVRDEGGLNQTTTYEYDGIGNQIKVTDPVNSETLYVNDNLGQIRFIVDAESLVTEIVYDALGQVVKNKQYLQATNVAEYTLTSLSEWVSNQTEFTSTQYIYNSLGQVRFAINAEGFVSENRYDEVGNLSQTIAYESLSLSDEIIESYLSAGDNIDNIIIYDTSPAGATVSSVFDEEKGTNVVQLSGTGQQNGFRLLSNDNLEWNNTSETNLSWDIKFSEELQVAIKIQTTDGVRYLRYMIGNAAPNQSGNYITHYLSAEHIDGNWHTIERDLIADLAELEPDNTVLSVEDMSIRGSGRIDNVQLKGPIDQTKVESLIAEHQGDQISTRYYYDELNRQRFAIDAEGNVSEQIFDVNGNVIEIRSYQDFELGQKLSTSYLSSGDNIDNFSVYDNSPAGATITTVFDAEKQTDVVQLSGSAMNNGYELNDINDAYWNNSKQFDFSIDFNFEEDFKFFVSVDTNFGQRWVSYSIGTAQPRLNGSFAEFFLSAEYRDGNWHTLERNLADDLAAVEPGIEIIDVNNFRARGSGLIDNVKLSTDVSTQAIEERVAEVLPPFQSSKFVYDEVGQLRYQFDAEGYVSENIYDANGQIVETRRYQDRVEISESSLVLAGEGPLGNWIGASPANDVFAQVYDVELETEVLSFDGYGFVLDLHDHQNIPLSTTLTQLDWDMKRTDNFTFEVYVALASGENVSVKYDPDLTGAAYQSGSTIYIPLPELTDNEWHHLSRNIEADIRTFISDANVVGYVNLYVEGTGFLNSVRLSSNGTDYVESALENKSFIDTQYFYDAIGNTRFVLDAEGFITENEFDANNNIIATKRYANAYSSTSVSYSSIDDWSKLETNLIENYLVLDTLGRVRFSIDSESFVTENRYDAAGRVIETWRYADPVSITSNNETPLTVLQIEVMLGLAEAPPSNTENNGNTGGTQSPGTLIQFDQSDDAQDYQILPQGSGLISIVNEQAVFKRDTYEEGIAWIEVLPKQLPSLFSNASFEFTTDSTITEGAFVAGLDNNDSLNEFQYKVQVIGQNVYIIENIGGEFEPQLIGTVSGATTYTVEFSVTNDVASVFVYEKGTTKETGLTHTMAVTDSEWGDQTQLKLSTVADSVVQSGEIALDNIQVLTAEQTTSEPEPPVQSEPTETVPTIPLNWLNVPESLLVDGDSVTNNTANSNEAFTSLEQKITNGTGSIEFSIPNVDPAYYSVFIGVKKGANSATFIDQDFGFMINSQGVSPFESIEATGNLQPYSDYSVEFKTTDTYRILLEGSNVHYQRKLIDGNYETFYISSRTLDPNEEYSVTLSIYSVNATVDNIIVKDGVDGHEPDYSSAQELPLIWQTVPDTIVVDGDSLTAVGTAADPTPSEEILLANYFSGVAGSVEFSVPAGSENKVVSMRLRSIDRNEYYSFDILNGIGGPLDTHFGQANITATVSDTYRMLMDLDGVHLEVKRGSGDFERFFSYPGPFRSYLDYTVEFFVQGDGAVVDDIRIVDGLEPPSSGGGYGGGGGGGGGSAVIDFYTPDIRQYNYSYDKVGQTRFVLDPDDYLSENIYDGHGRIVQTIRYDEQYNFTSTEDFIESTIESWTINKTSIEESFVYDNLGQVRFVVDGDGYLSERSYDAYGQVVSTQQWQIAIPSDKRTIGEIESWLASVVGTEMVLSYVPALGEWIETQQSVYNKSNSTYNVFNSIGQVRYQIDAEKFVTEFVYDFYGNRVSTRRFEEVINEPQYNETTLDNWATGKTPVETHAAFDALGQVRFSLDAEGYVVENVYDAYGRLMNQRQYEEAYTLTDYSVTAFESWSAGQTSKDVSRNIYDQLARLRFTINAMGYVTENIYDSFNNVVEMRAYDRQLTNVSFPISGTDLLNLLSDNGETELSYRSTAYEYDDRGNLTATTDAIGNQESNIFDAHGNRRVFVNKLGDAWEYTFDGRGNLTDEISPEVVATYADGSVSELQKIVKHFEYDAFGNVKSITDGYGSVDHEDISIERTTEYSYDARGNQTTITHNDQGIYSESLNKVVLSNNQSTNTSQYNAFGLAIVNVDELNHSRYKTYTALGLVEYEIDAEGYVTHYQYDNDGNVSELIRYANALTNTRLSEVNSKGVMLTSEYVAERVSVNNSDDRSVSYEYDDRGLQTRVIQREVLAYNHVNNTNNSTYSDSPETEYLFNAMGQPVKQSVKINDTDWAVTYTYYNDLGQVSASVDPLGYLTTYEYDAFGNRIKQTEYAEELKVAYDEQSEPVGVANSKDRVTRFVYDSMNRLTDTIQESVSVAQWSGSAMSNYSTDVENSTVYDKLGRATIRTDADKNTATTHYDVLGRITSVEESARSVAHNEALDPFISGGYINTTPTTNYEYNLYGELVKTTKTSSAGSARGDDIVTSNIVDFRGNVVKTVDALGHEVIKDFDAKGQLIETRESVNETVTETFQTISHYEEEWDAERQVWIRIAKYNDPQTQATLESYQFTRINQYEYDSNGRQIESRINTFEADGSERFITNVTGYNGFGEISNRGLQGEENTFIYSYDNTGRLIESNQAGGIVKNYLYDLTGKQTREFQDGTTGTTGDDRYSYFEYDLIGNATLKEGVAYTAFANSTSASSGALEAPIIEQEYDRWGNVTKVIDAAGEATKYEYNYINQLTKETKAAVSYYNENGQEQPEFEAVTEHYYDNRGLRIGERDAENFLMRFSYDEGGLLIAQYDRFGYATEYAYDVHGRRVFTKDALGYIRSQQFDDAGNITQQGIIRFETAQYKSGDNVPYLNNVILTSYIYDELGQRTKEFKGDASEEGALIVNQYKYDTRGNITLNTMLRSDGTYNVGERRTFYEFDDYGNKVKETDANGYTLDWDYNEYGVLQSYTNLADITTVYDYTDHGQVEFESYSFNDGFTTTRSFEYWENGMLKSITDERQKGDRGVIEEERDDDYYLNRDIDYFEYDIAGRQVYAKTNNLIEYADTEEESGITQKFVTIDGFISNTRTEYDELGRIKAVKTPNSSYGNELVELKNYYDKRGNKRAVISDYKIQNSQTVHDEIWYTYDKENRVTSKVDGPHIENYSYDWLGQRNTSIKEQGTYSFPIWIEGDNSFVEYQEVDVDRKLEYFYDDLGNLDVTKMRAIMNFKENDEGMAQPSVEETDAYLISESEFDDWGRAKWTVNYSEEWIDAGIIPTETTWTKQDFIDNVVTVKKSTRVETEYNAQNEAIVQYNFQYDEDNPITPWNTSKFDFAGGYDLVGNQRWYRVTVYENNNGNVQEDYTLTYENQYAVFDSYKKSKSIATRSDNVNNPGESTYNYDYRGNLQSVIQQDELNPAVNVERTYKMNRSGQIIGQREGVSYQNYYYVNGQGVADLGTLSAADFDYNQQGFEKQVKQASPSQYVVRSGDSLKSIASLVYGDSSLWYILADANGVASDDELIAGMHLNIPAHISNSNNADTFRPYNPGDIIGDTSPIAVAPPMDAGCSALASIIVIIVVIIVTIYTAGAAAPQAAGISSGAGGGVSGGLIGGGAGAGAGTGAVATTATAGTTSFGATMEAGLAALSGELGPAAMVQGAFLGNMAGNAAGQIVGNALGVRDGYSLGEVFTSGISAAASAGITHGLGFDKTTKVFTELTASEKAISAATSVITNAAVNRAVGGPGEFHWSDIAASAAGAYIGDKIGLGHDTTGPLAVLNEGNVISQTFNGIVHAGLKYVVKKGLFNRGSWDFEEVATNAFGSALGNTIAQGVSRTPYDPFGGKDISIEEFNKLSPEEKDRFFESLEKHQVTLDELPQAQSPELTSTTPGILNINEYYYYNELGIQPGNQIDVVTPDEYAVYKEQLRRKRETEVFGEFVNNATDITKSLLRAPGNYGRNLTGSILEVGSSIRGFFDSMGTWRGKAIEFMADVANEFNTALSFTVDFSDDGGVNSIRSHISETNTAQFLNAVYEFDYEQALESYISDVDAFWEQPVSDIIDQGSANLGSWTPELLFGLAVEPLLASRATFVFSSTDKFSDRASIFTTKADDWKFLDRFEVPNSKVFDGFSAEARFSLGNASVDDLAKIAKLSEGNPDIQLLLRSAFYSQRKAAGSKVLDPKLADFSAIDNPLAFVERSLGNLKLVESRGFPFGFSNKTQFHAFRDRIAAQVDQLGIPRERVILQGSNLFKNNPGDIDIGIRLTAKEFDDFVTNQSLLAGKSSQLSSVERAIRVGKLDDTKMFGPPSARRAFRNNLVELSTTRNNKVDFSLIKENSIFDQIISRRLFSF